MFLIFLFPYLSLSATHHHGLEVVEWIGHAFSFSFFCFLLPTRAKECTASLHHLFPASASIGFEMG